MDYSILENLILPKILSIISKLTCCCKVCMRLFNKNINKRNKNKDAFFAQKHVLPTKLSNVFCRRNVKPLAAAEKEKQFNSTKS